MGYGKADFRARREALGLMQADVADEADVNLSTVKRWERPGGAEPPEDVWAWIEDCERMQAEVVDAAVSAAVARGRGPVQITYYRTQEQYDALGRDPGPVGVANANARLVAHRLRSLGYEVDYAYPDDPNSMYHSGR